MSKRSSSSPTVTRCTRLCSTRGLQAIKHLHPETLATDPLRRLARPPAGEDRQVGEEIGADFVRHKASCFVLALYLTRAGRVKKRAGSWQRRYGLGQNAIIRVNHPDVEAKNVHC